MLCRLCVYECHENGFSLFSDDKENNLIKIIIKYLHLKIQSIEPFSAMICKDCVCKLMQFHEFYEYIEERQRLLLENNLSQLQMTAFNQEDSSPKGLKDGNITSEVEIQLDNPLSHNKSDNKDKNMKETLSNSSEHVNEEYFVEKKETLEVTILKSDKKQIRTKKPTKLKQHLNKKPSPNELKKSSTSPEKEDFKHIKSVLTKLEDKKRDLFIAQQIDLKCDICGIQMESCKELKKHFRTQHDTDMYIICCGRKLRKRFDIIEHLQTHLNPDFYKCNICNKVLKSRPRLQIHVANRHSDRQELKFKCQQCDKRFACSSNLRSHLIVHSNERNHKCGICLKAFKSSKFLKAHMIVHNETTPFVCETCGRGYKNKVAFQRHVEEHAQGPKERSEQCSICKKWFMQGGVQRHMPSHNMEKAECRICGKILKSKTALRGHIEYCHRQKIYNCTFCDKTFKRQSVLKEHIAIHTDQKDYKCPHCLHEFRSSANMYAHIKKKHVEEWMKAKSKRYEAPKTMNCSLQASKETSPNKTNLEIISK